MKAISCYWFKDLKFQDIVAKHPKVLRNSNKGDSNNGH